ETEKVTHIVLQSMNSLKHLWDCSEKTVNPGIDTLNLRFGAICYYLWDRSNQENTLFYKKILIDKS
ncbi:MAG: hypothetical protein RL734_1934, partial [Bacteroidota bacterium]